MGSVRGLNCQLSLPGKNIEWNMTNALSKSETIRQPRTIGTIIAASAVQNVAESPHSLPIFTTFVKCSTAIIKTMPALAPASATSKTNSGLQSIKCAAPLSE